CRRSRLHSYRPLVEVLEGRSLLSFITAPAYTAGINPNSVAVGDFNGDGIPDLAVANFGTYPDFRGTVSILLGKGDGTCRAAQNFAVGLGAISLAVGDLNGDGHPDLAVANAGNPNDLAVADTGSVSVFLGKGDGTFQAAHNYPVTTDLSVVVT